VALSPAELDDLHRAKELLESPSIAVRVTDLLGKPIEMGVQMLPEGAAKSIQEIARRALERAIDAAIATLKDRGRSTASERWHKWATASTGALGGFFGLAGLTVELPLTTVIMLRSIADIARSEGHDIGQADVQMACLEVFALGGPSKGDDAVETGYYAVRGALAKVVSEAAQHVTQRGMLGRGAPALVRLIERVAARFGLVVQEKVALEMIPAIGAVSGALVNTVFMGHFQNTARGHFIIKRLESMHGMETVREAYRTL
jgi:hypothetical protein